MLVRQVVEFIGSLRAEASIADFDKIFLNKLNAVIMSSKSADPLSAYQIEFIQQLFSDRWKEIIDTPNDYTFSDTECNKHWIKLARDLTEVTGKTHVQLLIPPATNMVDPIVFSKLVDCVDLCGLYFGADGKTLYSMEGLYARLKQQNKVFSTYNAHTDRNKYNPRPVTLLELFRIRSKRDNGNDFWSYLTQKVAPKWALSGEPPKFILKSLLAIVEQYFLESSLSPKPHKYLKLLQSCANDLQECSIVDVNCLYGQKIQVGANVVFLIDLLLDALHLEHSELRSKMLGIAGWLCDCDASLTLSTSELQETYSERKVGAFFTVHQLSQMLNEINVNATADVQAVIKVVVEQIESKKTIDAGLIHSLGALYRLRWLNIIGGLEDFTQLRGKVNAPWIRLAQLLCGAGHIKANYYAFLMPTITHDKDPVTLSCLTSHPLSHYIVSEDGLSMILLDNSVQHFKLARTFYNCNSIPPMPFTKIELERLQHAHARFFKYTKVTASIGEDDLPITFATVMAVKALIDGSVYSSGLYKDIDDAEMLGAQTAYQTFYKFLQLLSPDERKRLNVQCIYFNGHNRYFCEILSKIEQGECIALYGRYFTQMVLDYAPYVKFNEDIELKLHLHNMRVDSRKKVYRDYDSIDQDEAKRRILALIVSILTHNFQLHKPAHVVSLWDCSNGTTNVIKDMFELLRPMIESGDFSKARYYYVTIIESIVKPAITDKSWLQKVVGSKEVQCWLNSIINATLFNEKTWWFNPDILLRALLAIKSKYPGAQRIIEGFFDDLIQTYVQPQDMLLKELRVNIRFVKLLNTLEESVRNPLLESIVAISTKMIAYDFFEVYAGLLVERLSLNGALLSDKPTTTFFGKQSSYDMNKQVKLKETLIGVISRSSPKSAEALLSDLRDKVQTMSRPSCDDQARSRMNQYLAKMMSLILLDHPQSSGPVLV